MQKSYISKIRNNSFKVTYDANGLVSIVPVEVSKGFLLSEVEKNRIVRVIARRLINTLSFQEK